MDFSAATIAEQLTRMDSVRARIYFKFDTFLLLHIDVSRLKYWFSWRFRLCLSKWCRTSVWVACGPKETRRKTCLPPSVPPLHSSTPSQTRS